MGRSSSPDIEENKLFIRGVTDDVTENMISDYFSKFGRVIEVYLARDFETKLPRGFAFVTFEDPKDCDDACKSTNGKDFHGKPLHVEKSSKSKSYGSLRARARGVGRGFSGRGRSPPMAIRDYEYRTRLGVREEKDYLRGRSFVSRGGRMNLSPPLRDYEYRTRSPPLTMPSRSEKYYDSRDSRYYRDNYDSYPRVSMAEYSRSRYEDYRPRSRYDYSPPKRDYESSRYPTTSSRSASSRDYYDYIPSNGRYSPVPQVRRDYEREIGSSRFINQTYRPSNAVKSYAGYSSRSSYMRDSSPPMRGGPREYQRDTRDSGSSRRGPPGRSISPPPKRIKSTADSSFDSRRSPLAAPSSSNRSISNSRRF